MQIQEKVSLSNYSTMRLGGIARYLAEVTDRFQIQRIWQWAHENNLPVITIGEGSNIIWRDEGFNGLVIVNKIERFESFENDSQSIYVTGGAGENWDSFVARTVQMGLSGIEALSLVPGTVGATPVQNVGAYGQEVSNVITTIEAFDTRAGQLVTLRGDECEFSYRSSMFKSSQKGRYIITGVTFNLSHSNPKPPFYESLANYLRTKKITEYTPKTIRDAVIAIRSEKLPNPAVYPNNGSFFQNPIIEEQQLQYMLLDYPSMRYWRLPDGKVKLSAAWLLENTGFKDFHDGVTGMATWPKQPLVFVNEKASSTKDLLTFKQTVVNKVKEQFGIELVQEPELLP